MVVSLWFVIPIAFISSLLLPEAINAFVASLIHDSTEVISSIGSCSCHLRLVSAIVNNISRFFTLVLDKYCSARLDD